MLLRFSIVAGVPVPPVEGGVAAFAPLGPLVLTGVPMLPVGSSPAQGFIRAERDRLLTKSDWTQGADSTLSDEAKALWATYRAELRGFPNRQDLTWGTKWPEPPVLAGSGFSIVDFSIAAPASGAQKVSSRRYSEPTKTEIHTSPEALFTPPSLTN